MKTFVRVNYVLCILLDLISFGILQAMKLYGSHFSQSLNIALGCFVGITIITLAGILIVHEDIMYNPSSKYLDTGTFWLQDESHSL